MSQFKLRYKHFYRLAAEQLRPRLSAEWDRSATVPSDAARMALCAAEVVRLLVWLALAAIKPRSTPSATRCSRASKEATTASNQDSSIPPPEPMNAAGRRRTNRKSLCLASWIQDRQRREDMSVVEG